MPCARVCLFAIGIQSTRTNSKSIQIFDCFVQSAFSASEPAEEDACRQCMRYLRLTNWPAIRSGLICPTAGSNVRRHFCIWCVCVCVLTQILQSDGGRTRVRQDVNCASFLDSCLRPHHQLPFAWSRWPCSAEWPLRSFCCFVWAEIFEYIYLLIQNVTENIYYPIGKIIIVMLMLSSPGQRPIIYRHPMRC